MYKTRFPSTTVPRQSYQSRAFIPPQNPREEDVAKLFSIVLSGDIPSIMKTMSETNLNANIYDENKNSLLHVLISSTYPTIPEEQKLQVIKFLIDNGAHVNTLNTSNLTPLHLAAKYNYPNIAKYLISKGAYVNVLDNNKRTPLHYAVQNNLIECNQEPEKPGPSEQLFEYKKNASVEFKEINTLLVDIFSHEYFHKYFTDMSKTIEFYIDDNEDVKNNLEEIIKNITADLHMYENKTDFSSYVNTKLDRMVLDLKQDIMKKMNITKASETKRIAFGLDENKTETYKTEITNKNNERYGKIIRKMAQTLNKLINDTGALSSKYYDIIKNVHYLDANFRELDEIDRQIQNLFSAYNYPRQIQKVLDDAKNYHSVIVTRYGGILQDQPQDEKEVNLKLVNDNINLGFDSKVKRLYHTKYLIEYANTIARILYDIFSHYNKDRYAILYLKLALPSIEHIIDIILVLNKINKNLDSVEGFIKHVREYGIALNGIKSKQQKIATALNLLKRDPNFDPKKLVPIQKLLADYKDPNYSTESQNKNKPQKGQNVSIIRNITNLTKIDVLKSLNDIYADTFKYYSEITELIEYVNNTTSNKYISKYTTDFVNEIQINDVFNKLIVPSKKLPPNFKSFLDEYKDYINDDDDEEYVILMVLIQEYVIYLDDTIRTSRQGMQDLSLYLANINNNNNNNLDNIDIYVLHSGIRNRKDISFDLDTPPDDRPDTGKGYLLNKMNPDACTLFVDQGIIENDQTNCIRKIKTKTEPLFINKGSGFKQVSNNNFGDYVTLLSYFIAEQFKDITDNFDPKLENAANKAELLERLTEEKDKLAHQFRAMYPTNDQIINEVVYNIFANGTIKIINIYLENKVNVTLFKLAQKTISSSGSADTQVNDILKASLDKDIIFDFKKFDTVLLNYLANQNQEQLIKYNKPKFIPAYDINNPYLNTELTNNKYLSYVYDQSYDSNISHTCVNPKTLEVIKILLQNNAKQHSADVQGFIPLCYAINTLNLDLVNIFTKDSSFKQYNCSFNYFYKQYIMHQSKLITLNNLKSTLVFHKAIESKMISDFISKEAHQNQVPKYIENLLPQAIIMFNHHLYDQMLKYFHVDTTVINSLLKLFVDMNDTTYANALLRYYATGNNNLENVYRLMLIVNDKKLDAIRDKYIKDLDKYDINDVIKYNNKRYLARIPNYDTERHHVADMMLQHDLDEYIVNLTDKRNELNKNIPEQHKSAEEYNNLVTLYYNYFDDIKFNTLNIKALQNVSKNYDNLFQLLDQNSRVYEELWKNYITTPCVYTNLHLILVKLMMYYVKNNKNNGLHPIPLKNLALIKKIYENAILVNIQPYINTPKIYAPKTHDNNKLLKAQVDITVHIIKTNIMTDIANVLYALIVTHFDIKQNQNIIKDLYTILVNNELCLKIVKYVLKINDKDEKTEMSNDFIFQDVTNYLQSPDFSKNTETSNVNPQLGSNINEVITIMNDNIKIYYTDLLISVIENMQLVLDNYVIYIINDYKYLEIFDKLITS